MPIVFKPFNNVEITGDFRAYGPKSEDWKIAPTSPIKKFTTRDALIHREVGKKIGKRCIIETPRDPALIATRREDFEQRKAASITEKNKMINLSIEADMPQREPVVQITAPSPEELEYNSHLAKHQKVGNRDNGKILTSSMEPTSYAIDKKSEQERRERSMEGAIATDFCQTPSPRNKRGKGEKPKTLKDDITEKGQFESPIKARSVQRPRKEGEKQNWKTFLNTKQEEVFDMEKKMKDIMQNIGGKAAFKFRNLRDAFRLVDVDKSGSVNKEEMRDFFRQFNLPYTEADLLFDYLDYDESGELDYIEFMEHFGPVIQPGCSNWRPKDARSRLDGGGVYDNNVVGNSLRKLG